ncbi:Mut7-C RNAse domain-containing protein [Sulfurimonas sp. HSL-3221]|uniref:Mut7-C RNAse domain-containing protein n=1 Tax=Sulfurimonadaceae TaxID=2771471 RepID=UPI001E4AE6DA|nr:Mut7-C RNAse domain-containing protein [Sulfurimonas sp. HSL-3221]UFS63657.1 Mut7-C RNAse domain-containing protein [Sulfurimonas sp. HSL-3221]
MGSAQRDGKHRFIADCHLGRVAKYLRFMGYDTLFFPTIPDTELLRVAKDETRTILTRDAALSQRKNVPVYLLDAVELHDQLRELAAHFGLEIGEDVHRRCLVCNAPLVRVCPAAIQKAVPEKVYETFDTFRQCPECGRVYWNGDHYRNMILFLKAAL